MFAHSLDPHSDGFSKSLAECLGLAHLQGEDLTTGQRCEGCIKAKRLGDACIKNNNLYSASASGSRNSCFDENIT